MKKESISSRDLNNLGFFITGLDGKKKYDLIPLRKKVAANIFHNVLLSMLESAKEIIDSLAKDGKDKDEKVLGGLFSALKTIDFDSFWFIAERILKDGTVNNTIDLGDINETSYFEEHPDELYLAVFHGILENWPSVFSKVREKLSGFSLADIVKRSVAKQNTELTE